MRKSRFNDSPENQPKIACPVPKVGRIEERLNGTVRKECLNLNGSTA